MMAVSGSLFQIDFSCGRLLNSVSCCKSVLMLKKKMTMMLMMMMLLIMLVVVDDIQAFNIDIKNVKTAKGPAGSHFGYTIAYDENAFKLGKTSLKVGAPKQDWMIGGEKTRTAGTVHTCTFSDNSLDCTNASHHFPIFYTDPRSADGEGYGSSLSISQSGSVMSCAPFWKDTAYISEFYTFMPGRCSLQLTPSSNPIDVVPYFHTKESAKFYLPNLEYYHGLATFGFSTDVTEDSVFAFGSPGLTIFEGGVDVRDYKTQAFSQTIKQYRNTLGTTAYNYLGYDVKFGKFCARYLCLAAGAPNLDSYGAVRLYQWINREVIYEFQEIRGRDYMKTWSYFGSVLCAVDADQDEKDELLVGAPFYSDSMGDSGKVYIYHRKDSKMYELHHTLEGSGSKYSRFGSAIKPIGDINLDGYPDVAIGAPGEDKGTGCVYIYLGSSAGLGTKHSQRICGNQIPGHENQLKEFGATISGATKLKSSPYPAFAVSSHPTDTVLLFTTRVIVQVNVTIQSDPNTIDPAKRCSNDATTEPCTVLDICLKQEMKGMSTQKLDFILHLDLDTQRRTGTQRVSVMDPAETGKFIDSLGDIQAKSIDEHGHCFNFLVVTKKNQITKDRFTPIGVQVTVELDKGRSPKGLDPILDPTVPNTFSHLVSLANDCGSDNICNVDLTVEGSMSYSHNEDWPYVIVGYTKELKIDLTISNEQETSHGTRVTVELTQPLEYLRFNSDSIKQCKQDSTGAVASKTMIVCNYYQPLKKDSSIKISLIFDTVAIALDKKTIKARAYVTSTNQDNSPESNPNNNKIVMSSRVYIVADVDIYGTSAPSEVTTKRAKKISLTVQKVITGNFTQKDDVDAFTLNHKYQMKNVGPSSLPKTSIYLSIPAYLPDASQLLAKASVEIQLEEKLPVSCTDIVDKYTGTDGATVTAAPTTIGPSGGSVISTAETTTKSGPETTTRWTPGGGVNKRKKRDVEMKDLSKTYLLTCQISPEYCITFKCDIGSDIKSGGHVALNVTLKVDKRNIPIPKGFTSFFLQLQTLVAEPKHLLFKSWNAESKKQAKTSTNTVFHTVESGGEINIWIIIGSVIAGLFLILIIAVIFWKLGFFKRNKHYQVEEWKRKSQRFSRPPKTSNGDRAADDI